VAAPVPRDSSPETIGRYRVLTRLAADAAGEVYKAFDPMIERSIVVKVFSIDGVPEAARPAVRDVFYREVQRVGLLTHPGIVTLFDAGELADGLFLATEFVEGASLADWLGVGITLALTERLAIVSQAADALTAAGTHGVAHLSLRPAAVLISADGTIRVRGFGVAPIFDAIQAAGGAGPAALPGRYLAPERAGGAGDTRADVFALAQIALEVLGDTIDPRAPHLAPTFARALAADPAARHDSADHFAKDLLLGLGMSDLEVRLAWEATREVGTVLSAEREAIGLPHELTPPDAMTMVADSFETRLAESPPRPPKTERRD
jgi:serine/threonine-protein kinase